MRVVHVVPDLSPASGGQSATALELAGALAQTGTEAALVTTDHGLNGLPSSAGLRLAAARCALPWWRWAPGMAATLRPLLRRTHVAHLHGLWLHPVWAAARLCRVVGVPYLVIPQGMLDRWSLSQKSWRKRLYALLLERHTLRGAAAIHFTSDAERDRSDILGSRAPACVVPLGLPRTAWEKLSPRGNFRRQAGLGDKRLVLFLGRVHPKKRPDLLLQAFAEIAGEFPDAVLVIAGPGDARYAARLRELAKRLRVDQRVLFPGLLRGRAVQEALVDADLFALPSLQENFALAVAEAMAAGCPVVVSPHVGLAPEIGKHGAGLVAEAQLESLVEALRQLLRNADRRRLMGQNGRRLVLEQFTWERVAQQMNDVYEDVIRGTRTSQAWR